MNNLISYYKTQPMVRATRHSKGKDVFRGSRLGDLVIMALIANQRQRGELFNLNNQAGKVLVLDFWSTGCSICFKKFPEFDKLKQKYTSQSEIEFYAVNLIYPKEQMSSLKKVIDSFSYSFKTLYTDQNSVKQIRELLKIDAVPTIVVIDKKGMVVYSGALYIEKFVFIDNIYNIIESAKNNE